MDRTSLIHPFKQPFLSSFLLVSATLPFTDEDIIKLVAAYAANRQVVKELEGKVSELENRLKSIIGDCAGMKGEWGKIYWKSFFNFDWHR